MRELELRDLENRLKESERITRERIILERKKWDDEAERKFQYIEKKAKEITSISKAGEEASHIQTKEAE